MYSAPDFLKVKINIREPFAAYAGCEPDSYWMSLPQNTFLLTGCNEQVQDSPGVLITYVAEGMGAACYTTLNP